MPSQVTRCIPTCFGSLLLSYHIKSWRPFSLTLHTTRGVRAAPACTVHLYSTSYCRLFVLRPDSWTHRDSLSPSRQRCTYVSERRRRGTTTTTFERCTVLYNSTADDDVNAPICLCGYNTKADSWGKIFTRDKFRSVEEGKVSE